LKIDPFPENDQPLFSEYTTSIPEIVVFVKDIATDGRDSFFCNLENSQEEEWNLSPSPSFAYKEIAGNFTDKNRPLRPIRQ
jgi:hypothetical protein